MLILYSLCCFFFSSFFARLSSVATASSSSSYSSSADEVNSLASTTQIKTTNPCLNCNCGVVFWLIQMICIWFSVCFFAHILLSLEWKSRVCCYFSHSQMNMMVQWVDDCSCVEMMDFFFWFSGCRLNFFFFSRCVVWFFLLFGGKYRRIALILFDYYCGCCCYYLLCCLNIQVNGKKIRET